MQYQRIACVNKRLRFWRVKELDDVNRALPEMRTDGFNFSLFNVLQEIQAMRFLVLRIASP